MSRFLSFSIFIPLTVGILAIWETGYLFHVGVPVSCILVLILASEKSLRHQVWLIILSLILCIAGDRMLGHQNGNPNRFIYGILLFLTAHLGYLTFCLKKGRINKTALLILLLGYGSLFIFFLFPAIDTNILLVAVFLYLVFSCLSLAAAGLELEYLSKGLFIAGITFFVFSDTLIALNVFFNKNDLYSIMMPAYYMSHICITVGLIDKQVFNRTK